MELGPQSRPILPLVSINTPLNSEQPLLKIFLKTFCSSVALWDTPKQPTIHL